MQTNPVLFDSLHATKRAGGSEAIVQGISGTKNLGTLTLGKSVRASGRLEDGASDVYQFTVEGSKRNTLTLDNKIDGSLESVSITNQQENLSSSAAGNTAINGKGQVFNSFSNIPPGTYFLRLKGIPGKTASYSARLNYQFTNSDSNPATDFSSVLNQSGIDFSDASLSID
jgi:hypothetical protein